MRIVVAPDKFKGTVGAAALTDVLVEALREDGHEVTGIPMSDGGEGFLDVFGGANRSDLVTGPMGEPVEAEWRFARGVAYIEMARASGLTLVGGAAHNDPIDASTTGTGELIVRAVESGARRVIVGVGGSATTDGGLGALRAMHPTGRFRGVDLHVACDVRTRFVDAAEQFAPQKGASPAQVELLRRRLERLAQVYADDSGVEVGDLVGSGAAGGLAGALATIGAELHSGFDLVADEVALDEALESADLVITGEGFLDEESFDGKVVGGVAALAAEAAVPCLALVGEIVDPAPVLPDGLEVVSFVERFGAARSLEDPVGCAVDVVRDRLRSHPSP